MNTPQIIIITFSIIIAVVALLIFGGILPGFRTEGPGQAGEISFWGTLPQEMFAPALNEFSQRFRSIEVEYREVNPATYKDELVRAFAEGKGPDVFMLASEDIIGLENLAFALDSKTYPVRAFKDNFADIGELYIRPRGIVGLPIVIDPLVLYWNRALFRNAGLTQPPKTWDEFLISSQSLTIKEGTRIIQAGAAMGEFANISLAKDILALLMLQSGNKIIDSETLRPTFGERAREAVLSPGEEALLFFADFSNPSKNNFSWSRAMPEALEAFGGGRLAMYIGYASEVERILALNPHLDFDVAEVPQRSTGNLRATFGRTFAVSSAHQSQNVATALTFMYELTGSNLQELLVQNSFFAPSLRALLGQAQENPILEIFYRSAVRALGWLDPAPDQTREIWKNMTESVNSGARTVQQAVSDASRRFETLVPVP